MTQMYIILLVTWFPCAIGIMKIIKSALLTKRIMIGNILQLFSLGFCLLSIMINSGILYLLFTIMVFLANTIIQPVFFSYLGLYSKNSLYTLGMQSGIYVFITMIILFYTICSGVGVEKIIAVFIILLISSIVISTIFLSRINSNNNIDQ
ncbi:hypothetical protein CE143_03745 [Photorhabdus luminescens]|uniref:Uncharacterized protein n=2 Tax=Photorhabdus akhurstii TaxID=171438 RepID=A0ABX8LS31_9GAMM|nr:hypothetical protein B0X70_03810 [Photorhabdus akhurstii]UJD74171.1 hypothetical protein CE143_03745 [Photorhabdus luminescens]